MVLVFQVYTNPLIALDDTAEKLGCCRPNATDGDICGSYRSYVYGCHQCDDSGVRPAPFGASFEPNNKSDDRAFFHETSAASALTVRQACAVESLAFHNRQMDIHVLMTGRRLNTSDAVMQALALYGTIHVHTIRLSDYFLHSPLERWYFCTNWRTGPFAVSHLSDALRFLTIFKYGGYYFDLDFVMMRPVSEYRNFVGAESATDMAAGAFHADFQHDFIEQAVKEFLATYR